MVVQYKFLNTFNTRVLPIMAPFISGYIFGYMSGDVGATAKFQKYRPIHIKEAPFHNFYVYTDDDSDFKRCVEILEKRGSA